MSGIDISRIQRRMLDDAIDEARSLSTGTATPQAAAAWDRAAQIANYFANSARSESEKRQRANTAKRFTAVAQDIRDQLTKPKVEESVEPDSSCEVQSLVHRSTISFDQIAGLTQTKREIQTAYAISVARSPQNVQLPRAGNILFFGPPGCGKTLLAAAASNELDATFYSVKVSDLLSKYYGESSKLVSALYGEARKNPLSVIFLDEIDAIAGSREGMDHGADRKLLVSLLSELDGLNEKANRVQGTQPTAGTVLTIAATNLPWLLDSAMISRFQKQIYIPLPDEPARMEMMRILVTDKGFQSEMSPPEFAGLTEGLSGREIDQVITSSIELMMDEANPDLVKLALEGRVALQGYTIQLQPLTKSHFEKIRATVRSATTPDQSRRFADWQSGKAFGMV